MDKRYVADPAPPADTPPTDGEKRDEEGGGVDWLADALDALLDSVFPSN